MTLEELEKVVAKHMLLQNKSIIKLLCAYIVASRLSVRGPWLFLVSASGGGKSMLLESLETCRLMKVIDDLTPAAIASGMKGANGQSNSLLDEIKNGSVMVIKDFTTLLSKNMEEHKELIGMLRQIYDGSFYKRWGNGNLVDWHGKISILAGVTSQVHTVQQQLAAMGERFLMVTMEQPETIEGRIEVGMEATKNLDNAAKIAEMQKAFQAYVDQFETTQKEFNLKEEIRRPLVELAELASKARSKVDRNYRSREQEITMVHWPEMPGRFATQLSVLAEGYMILNNGELEEIDKKMLYKVTLDSIPHTRRLCLQALTHYAEVETTGLANHLKLPSSTIKFNLEELAALKVVDREKLANGHDKWQLPTYYRELIARYEGIKMSNEILEAVEEASMDLTPPFMVEEPPKVIEDPKVDLVQAALDVFPGSQLIK